MGTLWSELGPIADGAPDVPGSTPTPTCPPVSSLSCASALGWDVLFVDRSTPTCGGRPTSSTSAWPGSCGERS